MREIYIYATISGSPVGFGGDWSIKDSISDDEDIEQVYQDRLNDLNEILKTEEFSDEPRKIIRSYYLVCIDGFKKDNFLQYVSNL